MSRNLLTGCFGGSTAAATKNRSTFYCDSASEMTGPKKDVAQGMTEATNTSMEPAVVTVKKTRVQSARQFPGKALSTMMNAIRRVFSPAVSSHSGPPATEIAKTMPATPQAPLSDSELRAVAQLPLEKLMSELVKVPADQRTAVMNMANYYDAKPMVLLHGVEKLVDFLKKGDLTSENLGYLNSPRIKGQTRESGKPEKDFLRTLTTQLNNVVSYGESDAEKSNAQSVLDTLIGGYTFRSWASAEGNQIQALSNDKQRESITQAMIGLLESVRACNGELANWQRLAGGEATDNRKISQSSDNTSGYATATGSMRSLQSDTTQNEIDPYSQVLDDVFQQEEQQLAQPQPSLFRQSDSVSDKVQYWNEQSKQQQPIVAVETKPGTAQVAALRRKFE